MASLVDIGMIRFSGFFCLRAELSRRRAHANSLILANYGIILRGFSLARYPALVFVQITLNKGRKRFYAKPYPKGQYIIQHV